MRRRKMHVFFLDFFYKANRKILLLAYNLTDVFCFHHQSHFNVIIDVHKHKLSYGLIYRLVVK